jgi:hypothetical protein
MARERRDTSFVPLAIATGVVALALLGVLAWGFLSRRAEDAAGREASEAAAGPPTAKPTPAPPEPLPGLDASDALVREAVAQLSARPEVVVWLANDDLIRRFVAAVDNVAEGRSPRSHVEFLAPKGRFLVIGEGLSLRGDASSERRYDTLAAVVDSLDVEGSVHVYNRLEPLLESAYRDLGHPEGGFGERLTRAISELLAAPVVSGAPGLELHVFSYHYTDPELEGLSDAQKQLLRMGPRNVKLVQAKLREMALSLGIAPDALPRPRRYVAVPAGA